MGGSSGSGAGGVQNGSDLAEIQTDVGLELLKLLENPLFIRLTFLLGPRISCACRR